MKKTIAVAMGLAVLSGSAFASKARLQALGEDTNGSAFINDNRNIFYNAAQVNNHKDMVTMEWGDADAEGGFLRQSGNLVYGLHFGKANADWATTYRAAGGQLATDAAKEENVWDFFIGGDAGMQWGAGLTYGKYSKTDKDDTSGSETDKNDMRDTMRLRFGVTHGDLQVGLVYGLTNKASHADGENDTVDVSVTGKSDMDLNVAYQMNGMHLLLDYMSMSAEAENDADTLDETYKKDSMSLGVAKLQKINDTARANYKIAYTTVNEENNSFVEDDKDTETTLAATLGVEVDAKSWLTLRGSVKHNIMHTDKEVGDKTEVVTSGASSTDVATGASLMFGDLQFDGIIGATDVAGAGNEDGTLRTDALMTEVSMTYRF
jgi:hypothetical protein